MDAIDWEDVRHFTALAETLNLARAAARLSTSQVTVMRRVKSLETVLGATLFLRRRDGHRLTAHGVDLFRSTREAAQLIDEGASAVRARDARPGGRVRIATTELAANFLLLPALPAFLAAHPDIRLEIDASPEASRLTDDAETIALRFRRPEAGPLRIRRLGRLPVSLYRRASPPDPPSERYVGWAGAFADIGLARWLRRQHQDAPPFLTLTTLDGHLRAARAGLGVVALPDFIGSKEAALTLAAHIEPAFVLNAWLAVPEQIVRHASVRLVAELLEEAVGAAMQ